MSFTAAVRSVLTQYATFAGRASRSEFWFFVVFSLLASSVAGVVDAVVGVGVVSILVSLALVVPTLTVSVRRLHDSGLSGGWMLTYVVPSLAAHALLLGDVDLGDAMFAVLLTPLALIAFGYLNARRSTPGANIYGPHPLTEAPAPEA